MAPKKEESKKIITQEKLPVTAEPLSEEERLIFAKQILLFLGIVFIFSIIPCFIPYNNEITKEIFNKCSIIIPPIATFVIGHYFPKI